MGNYEHQYEQKMNQVFRAAKLACPKDPEVGLEIVFNDTSQIGIISISYPIIPGQTPHSTINQGLAEKIGHGIIHEDFLRAHLDHSLVQTKDEAGRRKLRVNFWK